MYDVPVFQEEINPAAASDFLYLKQDLLNPFVDGCFFVSNQIGLLYTYIITL